MFLFLSLSETQRVCFERLRASSLSSELLGSHRYQRSLETSKTDVPQLRCVPLAISCALCEQFLLVHRYIKVYFNGAFDHILHQNPEEERVAQGIGCQGSCSHFETK